MTADGHSVNGVRRLETNVLGSNVCALLRQLVQHRVLSFHCAAHRLQLAANDSFSGNYLKQLEKIVSSIFKHMHRHPASRIDLEFWSDITDEPLLTSLSVGRSRWLSLLTPLRKLHGSWKSLLAHLHFHFSHLADHESKKTIRWCFINLACWKARVVMAGVLDILTIANGAKNRLEKDLTLDEIASVLAILQERLRNFCQKSSTAAEALAGNQAVAAGDTYLEKVCTEYHEQGAYNMDVRYSLADGTQKSHVVPIPGLGTPVEVRETFRILKDTLLQSLRLCVSCLKSSTGQGT